MKKAILLSIFLFVIVDCGLRYTKDIYSIDFMFNWFFLDQRVETMLRASGTQSQDYGVPLNSSGFRGFWEFGQEKKGLRIIITGAGHSYADNISYGQAWPEIVKRKLQKNGTTAEIWNLSVNGSTVLFIERGFLSDIINSKPDFVILSHSGYNEAIFSRILEENTLKPNHLFHNFLFASEIIRSSYQFFHNQTTDTLQNKVPVQTFSKSYENIITQLQKNNISVILLQQEVVTPDIGIYWKLSELESYRSAFKELARKYQVPRIDPRMLIVGNQEEYFERQEYYSQKMHDKIGKKMGETIKRLMKKQ